MENLRPISNFILVAILAGGVGILIGRGAGDNGAHAFRDEVTPGKPTTQFETRPYSPHGNSTSRRADTVTTTPEKPSVDVSPPNGTICDPTLTFQEQMARMKFVELRRLCDAGEEDWRKRNLETRAPGPKDGVEGDQYRSGILDSLRERLEHTIHFRGQTSFAVGDRNIQVDVFLSFYNSKDAPEIQSKRRSLNIVDPMDLCYAVGPVFVVNGKPSQQSTSSMSTCGATLQKRGDRYYIPWYTAGDKDISPAISLVLIPLPATMGGAFEYLLSDTGQWQTKDDFQWRSSSRREFEDLQGNYQKRLEAQFH